MLVENEVHCSDLLVTLQYSVYERSTTDITADEALRQQDSDITAANSWQFNLS